MRLDADSKISPDLESAFFTVKGDEKEGSLLHILHEVIKIPLEYRKEHSKKHQSHQRRGKRDSEASSSRETPTEHSTIVFAATKHHVEYLASILRHAGFAISYVYGSLDQTARKIQVDDFRMGEDQHPCGNRLGRSRASTSPY